MTAILLHQSAERPDKLPSFVLMHSHWNDWWEYETQYHLSYYDSVGAKHDIGFVKIATREMISAQPDLPKVLPDAPFGAFSVGQDVDYYDNLLSLEYELVHDVFTRLGDIAYDPMLRKEVLDLPVTRNSLLRSVPLETLQGQFARKARGGAKLTDYDFLFRRSGAENRGAIQIGFKVTPESKPPTNIHVLVGRNGAGKSTLLGDMLDAFQLQTTITIKVTSLIAVSFSAFDSFGRGPASSTEGLRKVYSIGLKAMREPSDDRGDLKSEEELGTELENALDECWNPPRRSRLIRAIEVLENDPIFAESGFSAALKDPSSKLERVAEKYKGLSSGHKIVLLTMVRLVQTVEEQSLVLIDEPEAHLHPPLLSAYIRALSELLVDRNGLAIIATHSPVVLQEVPRSCVWKIARSGNNTQVGRPDIETFGENVGTLIHEVFGLEVQGTGFHGLLKEIALDADSYDSGLSALSGQLGQEGRAILRALMASHPTRSFK